MDKMIAERKNSDSGFLKGTLKGRPIECRWNSHELWIDGKMCQEHAFEGLLEAVFSAANDHIKTEDDADDVPFTSEISQITSEGGADFEFQGRRFKFKNFRQGD